MSVRFHYRAGTITLFFENGDMVNTKKGDLSFDAVKEALQKGEDEKTIRSLLNTKTSVETYTKGVIKVVGDKLYRNGVEVHNLLARRVSEYMGEGLPIDSLINYENNVENNPSFNSRQEAYDFTDRCNLPLTDDGCFIGYKGVRRDLYDIHSGTILNSIGAVIKKDRRDVDDNTRKLCSYGLHVGSYEYASRYAGDGVVLLVKVNPADVVSVANDAQQEKIRVCQYEVISVMENKLKDKAYEVHQGTVMPMNGAWSELDEDEWEVDEFEQMGNCGWAGCGCGDEDDDYDDDDEEVYTVPAKNVQAKTVVSKAQQKSNFHNVRDKNGKFTKKV